MADLNEYLNRRFPEPEQPEVVPPAELRGNLMQVQQHDPDSYARAMRLASDRNVPVDSVLTALPKLEQQAEVEALDPGKLSPELADWLKNPQNLAIARDDLSLLDTLALPYRAIRGGFTEGFEQNELKDIGFREAMGEVTPEELSRADQIERTLQARQMDAEAAGIDDSLFLSAFRESGKQLPQMGRTAAAAATGAAATGAVGAAVGAGAGSLAGGVGAIPGAIGGAVVTAPWGARGGAVYESFHAETGGAMREFRAMKDETGAAMDRDVARLAAVAVGGVNSGLEAFGLRTILKTIPGGDKLMGKLGKDAVKEALKQRTVREALKQVAVRYRNAVGVEAMTEMAQETVAILGREAAQAADGGEYAPDDAAAYAGRIAGAGKAAVLGTAIISGAGASVQAVGEVRQAQKAQETRETLNGMATAAENSKLRERLPEKFREYVERAQKDKPTENLYFNQSAFDDAAERMGTDGRTLYGAIVGSTEGYDEAVATGGHVSMPTAAYLDKVAGSNVHDEIAPDAKFDPADLSEREAAGRAGEMQQVDDLKQKILAGDEAGMPAGAKQAFDHFYGQLDRAGTYDRKSAEDQAAIAAAMLLRLADRSGQTVDALIERYGLGVRSTLPKILAERPAELDTQLFPLLDRLRAGDIPSDRDALGPSLVDFIRERGGLQDQGGELSARDAALFDRDNRKPGQRSLVNPEGATLDDMAEAATEAGYLRERDPNALLDLLDNELRGSPAFAMGGINDQIMGLRDALMSLDEYLTREGIDLREQDNAAVKQFVETGKLPKAPEQEEPSTRLDQDVDPRTAIPRRKDERGGRRVSDELLWDKAPEDMTAEELIAALNGHREQRTTDRLTGLGSDIAWQRAARKKFVASLDADGLKWVNDTLGHDNGDRLLAEMGKALGDTGIEAYHVSGDEFWAQADDEAALRQALETARQAMGNSVLSTDEWSVTGQAFSYGVAENKGQGDESLLSAAEKELQNEKADRQAKGLRAGRAERPAGARQAGESGYVAPRGADRPVEAGTQAGRGAAEAGESAGGVTPDGIPDPQVRLNQAPRRVTETPEFKAWFGDSKVVDADGKPLVVYHGTNQDIFAFREDKRGGNTKSISSRVGFFFTERSEEAAEYAEMSARTQVSNADEAQEQFERLMRAIEKAERRKDFDLAEKLTIELEESQREAMSGEERGANILPVYLRIENPLEVDFGGSVDLRLMTEKIAEAKVGGHDGLKLLNVFDVVGDRPEQFDTTQWVAFRPEQIKSAFNRGTFDINDPNILNQQPKPGETLGYIEIAKNRRMSISLLAGANMSTFQHEMAHAYLEMLRDLAKEAGASEGLKNDWKSIQDWLGVEGDAITETQHEKFARGWEAYLFEGNAPSITLGRAFARMKSWMLTIYKKMRNLDVQLNDDIRGVFDRMVAAEDEIHAARKAQGYAAMFADAKAMGVSEHEFAAYQRAARDDLQAGVDRLQRDVMDDLTRERRQWWKDEMERVTDQVTAEVDADPGYQALSYIRRKGGVKLDKKALVEEFGEPFVKRLPRGLYANDGGTSPSAVAALFEFESPAKLLEALSRADAMPRAEYIKAESERRMKEAHGDMMNDGSLPDRATMRIHNDKRADVLAFELRTLKRKQREAAGIVRAARQADRSEAREALASVPPVRVFREAARLAISRKSLRAMKPYNYLLSERQSGRKAAESLAAGKYSEAAAHKERELISHYMYLESRKAKDEGDKILAHARKQATTKRQQWLGKAGGDYLEQINGLLDQYEFRKVSGREVRRRESLAKFAERKATEGMPVDVPREVLARAQRVNYADVPMSELRGAYDTMQMIEHIAGLKNELLYNKETREYGAVVADVAKSIRDNNKERLVGQFADDSGLDKVRKHGRSVLSIVLQPGTLARGLDGGDRMGALSKHVVDPVAAAETIFLNRRRDEGDKVAAILDRYTPDERKRMGRERLEITGFSPGTGPTKWQAITLALNWGNEGNRQAILSSRDPNEAPLWDEGKVQAVLDSLDQRDWEFVQDVWKYVNSFWPEISEAQKRRTGLSPKKVEGVPVATKFGTIQGAYYPLKYEPRGSWAVRADEAANTFDAMRAGRTAAAYTPNGHTKERVGSGGRPVNLDIGVLGQHVDNVLRDIEMADAVNSAWRVLHDREVVAALAASDNLDAMTGFEMWLQDTASGEIVSGNSLMSGLRRVRTGFTGAVMLFNVTNALMNLTGLTQSAVVVGKGYMARAAAQVMRGPLTGENNVFQQVREMSPMMRVRLDTYNKDVSDHIRSLQGQGDWREKMTRWGYVPSMATQILVDTTTWLAAYERAKAEGLEGAEAVQFADRLTEDAQSSGRFGFRSSFERGTVDRNVRQTELARVWTVLMSYMLNKANRAYERTRATDFKSPSEVFSWVSDMVVLYTVEAMLVAMIKGNLPDDEEDEDLLAFAGKETAKAFLGSLPFVREAAAASQGFSGGGALGSLTDAIGKAYQQVAQGEADPALLKSVNMAAGILFGYPAAQINKFITALAVESDGKDVPVWQYVTGVPLKDR